MNPTNRRSFIEKSAKAGVAGLIAIPAFGSLLTSCNTAKASGIPSKIRTGFDQQPLGYAYNALEPYIDATTMDIHYNKHAGAYSKNAKEAATAEGVDVAKPIEDVLAKVSKYSVKMRNNAGGHYNHELFWKCMMANASAQPSGKLLEAIQKGFGSLDEMKKQFSEAAKTRFGSGWAWLIVKQDKTLGITSTPNQDNTLMDLSEVKGFPLLGIDVWEHAYYLKYQNKRAEYVDNFWKVVNWNYVAERLDSI